MSYGTVICQTVYKQRPERGEEQELDNGCDMMGMGYFRCHRELRHFIVFAFLYSDGCQPRAPADIRSIVSHFRVHVSTADESSLGRAR